MINHTFFKRLTLLLAFCLPMMLHAEATIDDGKTLFKVNCASCHNKNMKAKATGPALGGAEERWGDYPKSDLYGWIRNSAKLIAADHPRAVEIYNEWDKSAMTAMPHLTDENIESILLYVDAVYTGAIGGPAVAVTGEGAGAGGTTEKGLGSWVYGLLLLLLGFLALVLTRIIGNLNKIAAAKEGKFVESKSLTQTLTSKGVITFLIFAMVILGGYTTMNNAVNLGRQQGYAPEQPIKFSHATHAGLNKIDCQYCHDGARRSKHGVIPATNTCMNCHKAIVVGSEHGTAEITKIFASAGFDPNSNKYIENPETVHPDTIAAIYTKWIADNYLEANGVEELGRKGEEFVADQWNDIVSSLTNDQKESVYGPIEWERIHNLPDHVYFNHSQHVTVGEVECQTCHGPVEEMEVLGQHAPLSMGWCINCHRQTEVQFEGNEYYESYAKYHEEFANGTREKVTVEDIGGLECQKCHY